MQSIQKRQEEQLHNEEEDKSPKRIKIHDANKVNFPLPNVVQGAITNISCTISIQLPPIVPITMNVIPLNETSKIGKLVGDIDKSQVANYNVQPLLCIELVKSFREEIILEALLVEATSNLIIYKGFKAGNIQKVTNLRQVNFYGLKLNTLGHFRRQLEMMKFKQTTKDLTCKIRFILKTEEQKGEDNLIITESESFTLVSSFSQLPEDLQEKRQQRNPKSR